MNVVNQEYTILMRIKLILSDAPPGGGLFLAKKNAPTGRFLRILAGVTHSTGLCAAAVPIAAPGAPCGMAASASTVSPRCDRRVSILSR